MTTKHERKLLATVARTQCQGSLQYQELLFYYHHRATGFALKFDDDDDDRSIDPSSRYDTLQGVGRRCATKKIICPVSYTHLTLPTKDGG